MRPIRWCQSGLTVSVVLVLDHELRSHPQVSEDGNPEEVTRVRHIPSWAVSIDDARRLFRKLPDSLPKEMVVLQHADHAIGGDVGGFPEQGLTAYGEVMMSFLTDNAPGCLAEE